MLAFVTVGSTRFDVLVDAVLSQTVRSALISKGFTSLVIQSGESSTKLGSLGDAELDIQVWKYKPSLEEDYARADLVISHAGSGTILSVLRLVKPPPLIVVPNPTLADNHQEELAVALSKQGHLTSCSAESLASAIRDLDPTTIVPFPPFDGSKFRTILDDQMGFATS